jgi:hypothetical protein
MLPKSPELAAAIDSHSLLQQKTLRDVANASFTFQESCAIAEKDGCYALLGHFSTAFDLLPFT